MLVVVSLFPIVGVAFFFIVLIVQFDCAHSGVYRTWLATPG